MPRFYIEQNISINSVLDLNSNITKHIHALRLQPDQQITLFNGDGCEYSASIISINKNTSSVIVQEKKMPAIDDARLNIHLAVALVSSDKLDLIMRSCTELGIKQITPIVSQYSQRINTTRLAHKLEHWQKIIISACEQSNCNLLPLINTPVKLTDFIQENKANEHIKLALSPHHSSDIHQLPSIATEVIVLIGPEGGWSKDEVAYLQDAQYGLINLGQQILRTETACIAAIVTLKTLYDKWIK